MELSWSTFLLEIINFLVLVWILIHFLYRPILNVIEKRRLEIEQIRSTAKQSQTEAEALQQKYKERLADWETEKQKNRVDLQQDIQAERKKRFDQLNIELAAERERTSVIEQRHLTELQQHYQEKAMNQGARFATKLLQPLAMPELENKLIELLLTQLLNLPEQPKEKLIDACKPPLEKIEVYSAFKLNEEQQKLLANTLHNYCDPSIPINFEQDKDLIAGLRIMLGSWILGMNLQDELSGFATLSHEKIDS